MGRIGLNKSYNKLGSSSGGFFSKSFFRLGNVSPPVNNLPNIIFDTDTNNELDDQHALAYLLSNADVFNLEALTINATSAGGGIQNDIDEAERILQLYNLQNDITIYEGAQNNYSTISSGFNPSSFEGQAAVDKIISSTAEKECIIVAVGKLTNVALAILKDPTIVNRTRLVWLGTNYPCANEYNLESDIAAANYVLDSDMPMDIITVRLSCPQQGSSEVNTTVTEINNVMPGLGPLATTPITGRSGGTFSRFGDYSVDLFNNIGKELRSLFDLVALAVLKEPSWGQTEVIPAPLYENDAWTERPSNTRTVTIWGDFNRNAIINDFFDSIENYVLPTFGGGGPDTTPPVITLNGSSSISIAVGGTYTEPGVTATDNVDGDITANVVIGGDTVDVNTIGSYTITYNVSDAAGNAATQVTRVVNITDGTQNLLGSDAALTTQGNWELRNGSTIGGGIAEIFNGSAGDGGVGSDFSNWSLHYRNIMAEDNTTTYRVTGEFRTTNGETGLFEVGRAYATLYDQAPTANWVAFNVLIPAQPDGTYNDALTFGLANSNGGSVEIRNIVLVGENAIGDIVPPVITLVGTNPLNINVGDSYSAPSYTALDNWDGDITGNVTVGGDTVDPNTAGTYIVTYNVSDASGNAATQANYIVNVSASGGGGDPDILVDDNFATQDANWVLINGSTISGGVMNITANGSIGSNTANWSGAWYDFLNKQYFKTRRFRFTFDARQTSGSGELQVGLRYATAFDQVITGSWATYTAEIDGNAANADNFLTIGGRGVGDTFEIDNFTFEIIGDTSNPNVPGQSAQVVFYTDFEFATYGYDQWGANGVPEQELNQWEVDQGDPRTTAHPDSPVTAGREGTGEALWLGAYNSPTGFEYDRNELGKDEVMPFGETWTGFSFYVQNALPDTRLFYQLRNLAPGGSSTVNSISIRQSNPTNRLYISIPNDVNFVDQTEATLGTWNGAGTNTESVFADYNFRAWNDVVIHYKAGFGANYTGPDTSSLLNDFGYDPRTDGFIEIWLNGVKIIDHVGTTIYRYERQGGEIRIGMTPKIGTYWSSAFSAQGDIYYDNYKLWLGPNGTYADVDPAP